MLQRGCKGIVIQQRQRVIISLSGLSFLVLFAVLKASAANVSGRLTVGTYDSLETLAVPSAGDNTNNVSTVSGRFFIRATEVTSERFECVADVRDKNDYFGQVNAQTLQLTNQNTPQVRQLYTLHPSKFFTQVGRFSITQAGSVFTDGLLQGVSFSPQAKWAVFGGLNPKRPDQTYVGWNSDSSDYGTYLSYIPALSWGQAFFNDLAFVTNIVQSHTDRTYLYDNINYSWNFNSRLSFLAYLDFVPSTYLQTGSFTWQEGWSSDFTSTLNLFSIDVIEYQRLQSVLSTIPSSPYREASGRLRFGMGNNSWFLQPSYTYGHREADNLYRQESLLGLDLPKLFSRHWDVYLDYGYRDNFVSIDQFSDLRLAYFSSLWDVELDESAEIQHYGNGFGDYHPLISEISVSRTFDNALYGTVSFQDVVDERVSILTLFLKISYRFGGREIPPVRDGAPPRGRL